MRLFVAKAYSYSDHHAFYNNFSLFLLQRTSSLICINVVYDFVVNKPVYRYKTHQILYYTYLSRVPQGRLVNREIHKECMECLLFILDSPIKYYDL